MPKYHCNQLRSYGNWVVKQRRRRRRQCVFSPPTTANLLIRRQIPLESATCRGNLHGNFSLGLSETFWRRLKERGWFWRVSSCLSQYAHNHLGSSKPVLSRRRFGVCFNFLINRLSFLRDFLLSHHRRGSYSKAIKCMRKGFSNPYQLAFRR